MAVIMTGLLFSRIVIMSKKLSIRTQNKCITPFRGLTNFSHIFFLLTFSFRHANILDVHLFFTVPVLLMCFAFSVVIIKQL